MAKNVKVIQATSPILSAQSQLSVKKRRVAAYARVSTEKDEQQNSYEKEDREIIYMVLEGTDGIRWE